MRSLLIPGLALGFATMACAAASRPGSENARQPGETGASARSGPAGRAVVARRDRFRVGPNTGICIETRMDPDVRPRIEASGEHVNLPGLTADSAEPITQRLRDLGFDLWIDGGRRRRLFSYIEMNGDASCLTRPDTILIRQHVAAAGPEGYRVSVEASQGSRRYSASLTRRHTVILPPDYRRGLALDADRVLGLTTPFWDVTRDLHRLSTPLIDHLFAGAARAAQPEPGAIVIRAQANVCVSVHVDQRIWPTPLTKDSARNFSEHLMAELRRLYARSGGSTVLPGRAQEARFVTDEHGTNRLCRQPEDIRITVRYRPLAEGGPFAADYRIEQGAVVRSHAFSRDLMAEISSGRLRISNLDTIAGPIADDIRSRAEIILGEI